MRRITDRYARPWLWGIAIFGAGSAVALGGTVSLMFIVLGVLGTNVEDFDWRGWLGIGVTTGVPLFLVYRAFDRLGRDYRLNFQLMNSTRGRDLISRWY